MINTGIDIKRLGEGSDTEFRAFYKEYFPYFISFAKYFVRSEEDARDIVQEVFVSYLKIRNKFGDLLALKVFFYRSIRNRCLNLLRDSRTRKLNDLKDAGQYSSMAYFEEAVIREEVAMIVRREISKLPPQARRVLQLAIKGHTNTQIAEQLEISVNTVKSHKLMAYGLLRKNLKELRILLSILMP